MNLTEKIEAIETMLREVREEIGPHLPVIAALQSVATPPKKKDPNKKNAAQWRRQGWYLGAMKALNKSERKQVSAERKLNGYTSAIRLARSLKQNGKMMRVTG